MPPTPEPFEAVRPSRSDGSPPDLVEHLFALPIDAQLGVLRTVVPKVLASLGREQREGFMRDLDLELEHATRGEETYDIRTRSVGAGMPGETYPPGAHSPRHQARASAAYAKFLNRLTDLMPVARDRAEQIAACVLCVVEERLIAGEAADLEAQLPSKLRELIERCDYHAESRPRDIDRAKLMQTIAGDLAVDPAQAEVFARAVFRVLSEQVSAGEIEQVKHLLPADLRSLWPA